MANLAFQNKKEYSLNLFRWVSLKDGIPGWNFIFNQKLIIASGREYGILYTILYVNLQNSNSKISVRNFLFQGHHILIAALKD